VTRPARLERVRVQVTAVDTDGTALVRDQLGKERRVRTDIRPKGTGPPAAGETWEAVQHGTTWRLDRMVGHPPPVVVIGSRADPEEALANLLTALTAAGLIDDQTTA
jgi:hypothetical protein